MYLSISHVEFVFVFSALHLTIINMKPMETDAIISVAPCRECLDMYNYLKQVNLTTSLGENSKMLVIFRKDSATLDCSDLKVER